MKDPAFLFYSNDFLSGTMLMTDEQIGKYIKLLCLQHQKGRLKKKDMLKICKTYDEDIFSKFIQDEDDNYYNPRLEEEIIRRKKYSESRRQNRQSKENRGKEDNDIKEDMLKICKTYDNHMETENETINENININKENIKRKKFIPPTLEEVNLYIKEKQLKVDGQKFFEYFTEGGWKDSKGNQVKNWKQKLLTWNRYVGKSGSNISNNSNKRNYEDYSKFYANN